MDADLLHNVGRRINTRRKQLGYTQEQLADMLEVSVQMISNLERGVKSIRIENLVRLCDILNVTADYILTGRQTAPELHDMAIQISSLPERERGIIRDIVAYCADNNK